MAWDGMLTHEERANDPAWAFEAYKKINPRMAAFNGPVARSVWHDAVTWVICQQQQWDSIDSRTAVLELRKGPASIFYPLFSDDPKITADCPKDGVTVIGSEGYCPHCGFDFDR